MQRMSCNVVVFLTEYSQNQARNNFELHPFITHSKYPKKC